jgi:hypothetical protein
MENSPSLRLRVFVKPCLDLAPHELRPRKSKGELLTEQFGRLLESLDSGQLQASMVNESAGIGSDNFMT